MKKILIIISSIASIFFLYYLLLPGPNFPEPPPNSLQSQEPADSESPLRRAYFTDYTREEVMGWYKKQMGWGYRLNYPPENAATIIRDQTRSTFLEEIVHPLRESLYVNGFEPKNAKDAVIINGRQFRQKIILRLVPSLLVVRLIVFAGIYLAIWVIVASWNRTLTDMKSEN